MPDLTESSKAALRIALHENTQRKGQLLSMAEQYEKRADVIRRDEVVEIENKIREIMTDLDNY
jgi:hypothetical protein